jgi:hypothetical protein
MKASVSAEAPRVIAQDEEQVPRLRVLLLDETSTRARLANEPSTALQAVLAFGDMSSTHEPLVTRR